MPRWEPDGDTFLHWSLSYHRCLHLVFQKTSLNSDKLGLFLSKHCLRTRKKGILIPFHTTARWLKDCSRRQVIYVQSHAPMEVVKSAALQSGNAQADDPSLYSGCSLQGCFTLHEHNEIKVDWAEHKQAGADMVPQPSPSPGRWGGTKVAVHPPGATCLSFLKKGRGHGHMCVGLTDRHALSVPSRQTPATQPCQDMFPAENL